MCEEYVNRDSYLLHLENASINWGTTAVIEGLNWRVKSGEHWMVVGEMGSGKTTLAHAIMGEARISEGKLSFPALKDLDDLARHQAVKFASFDEQPRHPSVIETHYYQQRFQAFDSKGLPTVYDYLLTKAPKISDEVVDALEIEDLRDLELIKLSSGQTRRVILAAYLMQSPQLLLVDNLTVGLDTRMRARIDHWLGTVSKKFGTTVVLFGHEGKSLPKFIKYKLELSCPENLHDESSLAKLKAYAQKVTSFPGPSIALNFREVTIKYGPKEIISKLNWQVCRGDKWAIFGQNGSGKSSLISLIYGDHPQAYSNDLHIFGQRRGAGISIWDVKKQMGFTSPEIQRYFSRSMLVKDFLSTGYSDSERVVALNVNQQRAVTTFLAYFGLTRHQSSYLHKLSDGTKRTLYFIRALLKNPPLLLLDEPFQGMSSKTKEICLRLLDAYITDKHTLIFITHRQHDIPKCVKHFLYI